MIGVYRLPVTEKGNTLLVLTQSNQTQYKVCAALTQTCVKIYNTIHVLHFNTSVFAVYI